MVFTISRSLEILERTPPLLSNWIGGLSPEWTHSAVESESWTVFDVLGHLIHGEKTDWIVRLKIILGDSDDKRFTPFDRFAQFESSKGKTLEELLKEFSSLRAQNLLTLSSYDLRDESLLSRTGIHPEFGEVTLRELLAAWVAHDLAHAAQIARLMAKLYKSEAGPWAEYIKLLSQ